MAVVYYRAPGVIVQSALFNMYIIPVLSLSNYSTSHVPNAIKSAIKLLSNVAKKNIKIRHLGILFFKQGVICYI